MAAAELLGRAEELAVLERLVERTSSRPAGLLLDGEAGIGKTTLWRKGVVLARERGFRVFTCESAPSETPLAFAGLGDLLDDLPLEALRRLPPPQRNALEVSLLLIEPSEGPVDQHAVALAVLALIRALSAATPLVIAIDDVQWLDSSSTRVLAFALRRVRHGRVGLLMTRRSAEATTGELPFGFDRSDELGQAIERRTIGPLSLGAIGRLLSERTGKRVPRPLLTQLHRTTNGNPFFALELARAQLERGTVESGLPLQVPESLSGLIQERLNALPPATRETLLIAATLFVPTVKLLKKAGGGSLAKAIKAGVVEVDDGRVRFTHPLHASVIYSQAPPERRRELHHRLAAISPSDEERARHLALGNDEPSDELASELDRYALQAIARGAPEAAVELFEHAARLTPPEQIGDIRRRRIQTAESYYVAGDLERAQTLAEEILADPAKGPWRADALVLLSDLVEDLGQSAELCRQAVDAARGDDHRLALANIRLGAAYARLADQPAQLRAQRAALRHAESSGDSRLIVEALQGVVNAAVLGGGAIDETAMERAIAIESELGGLPVRHSPRFWLGDQLHLSDELDRARPLLDAALERSLQNGEVTDRLHIMLPLIDLETQAGNWERCERLIRDGLELALDVGQEYTEHYLRAFKLQLDVLRGEVGHARAAIEELLAHARSSSNQPQTAHLLSLAGFLELSAGDYEAAWRRLEPALQLQSELGRSWCCGSEMDYSNVVPNAIEALVALGRVQEAELLLTTLEAQTKCTLLPSCAVTTARSRALVAAAKGDLDAATEALTLALEAHESLQKPFELGRTTLVLGAMERRAKRKKNAREALEQASEIFDRLGARLWAEKARSELERVVGRRRDGLELTPTEHQIAELVAEGRSNKEIAAQLFLSVRTVEANLSNTYRKLGIVSRTELTAQLASLAQKRARE